MLLRIFSKIISNYYNTSIIFPNQDILNFNESKLIDKENIYTYIPHTGVQAPTSAEPKKFKIRILKDKFRASQGYVFKYFPGNSNLRSLVHISGEKDSSIYRLTYKNGDIYRGTITNFVDFKLTGEGEFTYSENRFPVFKGKFEKEIP